MSRALSWADLDIERSLGEGQSGSVVLARLRRNCLDLPEGSRLAIKKYKSWVLEQPGQIDRIIREVEVGRRVTHPSLLEIIGAVLDADGRPALVMKYYDGPTLESVLRTTRTAGKLLPVDDAFAILRALAAAIATLHANGVLHRDVKPANIVLTSGGAVLTDFGVIHVANLPEQTTTGAFLGTIRYAAPEYLFNQEFDERADLYSFGAVAYELFTGTEAFSTEPSWAHVVAAKANEQRLKLDRHELYGFGYRYGLNATHFAEYIVEHAYCTRHSRDLDLSALVKALDQRLWTVSFKRARGVIEKGEQAFSDLHGTATIASAKIRERLTPADKAALKEMSFSSHWWPAVKITNRNAKLLARFERADIGEYSGSSTAGTAFYFHPSVVEACALGML